MYSKRTLYIDVNHLIECSEWLNDNNIEYSDWIETDTNDREYRVDIDDIKEVNGNKLEGYIAIEDKFKCDLTNYDCIIFFKY